MKTSAIFALGMTVTLAFGSVGFAATVYVNPGQSIQTAINGAGSGDTVSVAAGTYAENIIMKDGVAVIGAGAGVTTIDGGASGSVVSCVNCSGATLEGFTIKNGSGTDIWGGGYYYGGGMLINDNSSATVTDCIFSGNTVTGNGGGIYNNTSSVTVTGCTFSDNLASYAGGGIYNYESSSAVTNCIFTSNAAEYGGGISNESNSTVSVTGCTITNNRAVNGGAVYSITSSVTSLGGCVFSGNSPVQLYGMFNDNGGNTIGKPIWYVDDNLPANFTSIQDTINASSSGDIIIVMPGMYVENINMSGKAITLQSINPTDPTVITTTIIDGNQSGSVITCISGEGPDTVISGFVITNGSGTNDGTYSYGGGMVNANSSSPTVSNCSFIGNTASNGGGMANLNSPSPTIINCTFSGNTTENGYGGGGMYNENSASPEIINCTFSGNTVINGFGGGGMYNYTSLPKITGSYFCGNAPDAIMGDPHPDSGGNNFEFCPPPGPIEPAVIRIPGDIDASGKVDMVDFGIITDPFGTFMIIAENWLEGAL